MYTTRLSLIARVGQQDEVSWREFYELYGPLVFRYGRQRGLRRDEAEEVVAACFEKLTRAMPGFDYDPSRGRFKSWLKRLVNNTITDLGRGPRPPGPLDPEAAAEVDPALDGLWERAWRNEVLKVATARARDRVAPRDYQIFQLNVLQGWAAERIADVFNISTDNVYRIKYRVLRIVREQAATLLD